MTPIEIRIPDIEVYIPLLASTGTDLGFHLATLQLDFLFFTSPRPVVCIW